MYKNDIAISSRSTDFNVQISAEYTLSLFTDVWTKLFEFKFNLSLCYF